MKAEMPFSFFDRVRVRSAPATEEAKVAGLVGEVHGETTPSITGVEVIGELKADYAIAVFFEPQRKAFWFVPELLELVERARGMHIELRTKRGLLRLTQKDSGDWVTEELRKPWWKFW